MSNMSLFFLPEDYSALVGLIEAEKAKMEKGRDDIRKEGSNPVCGYTNPGGAAVMQQADVQSVVYSGLHYQFVNAVLVNPPTVFDTAQIGTRVKVRWLPKGKKQAEVLPDDELKCDEDDILLGSSCVHRENGTSEGWVSFDGAIGKALLGKKVGDLTSYRVEKDHQTLRVLKIGPV